MSTLRKNITIAFAAIMLFGMISLPAFAENGAVNKKFNKKGNILISDQFNNRVIEVSKDGSIIWQFGIGPSDLTASCNTRC